MVRSAAHGDDWSDAEILKLHKLVHEGVSYQRIGDRLGRSKPSITGKINRLRKLEGSERWPERPSPIPATRKPQRVKRLPRGASTLPPL